jgi:hypothetical protein
MDAPSSLSSATVGSATKAGGAQADRRPWLDRMAAEGTCDATLLSVDARPDAPPAEEKELRPRMHGALSRKREGVDRVRDTVEADVIEAGGAAVAGMMIDGGCAAEASSACSPSAIACTQDRRENALGTMTLYPVRQAGTALAEALHQNVRQAAWPARGQCPRARTSSRLRRASNRRHRTSRHATHASRRERSASASSASFSSRSSSNVAATLSWRSEASSSRRSSAARAAEWRCTQRCCHCRVCR